MIVIDTNVLAHTWLPSNFSNQTKRLIEIDPEWIAPILWKSEFRSVLALYLRKGLLTTQKAFSLASLAEDQMLGREFEIPTDSVLNLVLKSKLSSYDCEFVALAQAKQVALITLDKKIVSEFPNLAFSLDQYLEENGGF